MPNHYKLKIRLREDFGFDGYEIFMMEVSERRESGQIAVVTNLTMTMVDPGVTRPNTMDNVLLGRAEAKQLMDDLWLSGVRPTNFIDNQGTVAAMKEHINDLRNVLNKIYERWLPG